MHISSFAFVRFSKVNFSKFLSVSLPLRLCKTFLFDFWHARRTRWCCQNTKRFLKRVNFCRFCISHHEASILQTSLNMRYRYFFFFLHTTEHYTHSRNKILASKIFFLKSTVPQTSLINFEFTTSSRQHCLVFFFVFFLFPLCVVLFIFIFSN